MQFFNKTRVISEQFEKEYETNRRNVKYQHKLLLTQERKTIELQGSIFLLFIFTCAYVFTCKTTGYIIYRLNDYLTHILGYYLYTSYFFSLSFYFAVGIYTYFYLDRMYLIIFTNEFTDFPQTGFKYARHIDNVECWNHDEIMTSVRNLFDEDFPMVLPMNWSLVCSCIDCSNFRAIMSVFSEPD